MKQKPNITLKNLADTKNIGLFLSLKKGLNEVFNKKVCKKEVIKKPTSCLDYEDILSIIICTTGNTSRVKAAVKSLLSDKLPKDKYEIIVVNNSPQTPQDINVEEDSIRQNMNCREHPACRSVVAHTGATLHSHTDLHISPSTNSPNLRIIHEPVLGLSKARNTGAREAKGEYLLYIDDDAIANPDLLFNIYSAYKDHNDFSIIGGQIFLKIPTPKPEIFLENRDSVWSGYTVAYTHFRRIKEHYEFPYGACFSIRHSVLDILGGFPESYGRRGNNFAGGEETALCFKSLKYGFKIGIEPKASVLHCVDERRFSTEHVEKTIRAGILTTYKLCKDGYAPYEWTNTYIKERIKILNSEIKRLKNNPLAAFYKECELSAFEEIL